jgi:hypothetical protein
MARRSKCYEPILEQWSGLKIGVAVPLRSNPEVHFPLRHGDPNAFGSKIEDLNPNARMGSNKVAYQLRELARANCRQGGDADVARGRGTEIMCVLDNGLGVVEEPLFCPQPHLQ